jgi:hypothetical protein
MDWCGMASRSKLRNLVLAGLIVLLGAAFFAWRFSEKPQASVTPNGYVAYLEGYDFSTNRVEYRLPKTPFDHKLIRSLPKGIRRLIPRPEPAMRNFTLPPFPGEPVLSAAFTLHVTSEQAAAVRVVTSDENGHEFDPVGQLAGYGGDNPIRWATEVPVFPRRGRFVNLKVKSNADTIAEFQIPNPARGEYPQWTPSPLPVSAKSGNVEVRLVDLTTEKPAEYGERFPATVCALEAIEDGTPTTNWAPLAVEIFDATGNHWHAYWYREREKIESATRHFKLMGALWPGENAWKIRVSYQKQAGFGDDELVRFEKLTIPLRAEIVRPELVHTEEDGSRLELSALLGPNVTRDQADPISLNIHPRAGTVTIVLKGQLVKRERSLFVLAVKDQDGKTIPLVEPVRSLTTAREETILPYVLRFKAAPETKEVSVLCAVPKTRQFEFVVKPR